MVNKGIQIIFVKRNHIENTWEHQSNFRRGPAIVPQHLNEIALLTHLMREGTNIFFVDKQYHDRLGIDDNSPIAMWRPKMKITGNEKRYSKDKQSLKVDAFEIEKKWIER